VHPENAPVAILFPATLFIAGTLLNPYRPCCLDYGIER